MENHLNPDLMDLGGLQFELNEACYIMHDEKKSVKFLRLDLIIDHYKIDIYLQKHKFKQNQIRPGPGHISIS